MTAHPEDDRVFVARWNTLISALIVEPSVKLVARTAAEYGITNGEDIYPGNERLARQTGYERRGVMHAWKILRGMGLAHRDSVSGWDGRFRTSDSYTLEIPDHWRSLPIYGPHFKRFHCQHCGKAFNPRASTHLRADGSIGYYLRHMIFCPDPGAPRKQANGRRGPRKPGCFREFGHDRWSALSNEDVWKLFRLARGDEWD